MSNVESAVFCCYQKYFNFFFFQMTFKSLFTILKTTFSNKMLLLKNFRFESYLKKLEKRHILFIQEAVSNRSSCTQQTIETVTTEPPFDATNTDTFGQPTDKTHPHLINKGDLVPGIKKVEFIERRSRLLGGIRKYAQEYLSHIAQTKNGHLVIVPSATKKYISEKIPYVFRQNSDFYYLSGCLEPDSVLMLTIDKAGTTKSRLFMRPKDKHAELWDGTRTGVENAPYFFGVDEAYSVDEFKGELQSIYEKEKYFLWYDSKRSDLDNITVAVQQATGEKPPTNAATNFIHSMRLLKSPAEQELMRRTCRIASDAINEVMCEAETDFTEHQLFAMIDYKCRMKSASHLAYPPVVASGTNATTIHYITNTQKIKNGDMVLLDAGCEYGGYTSDITRTWPISKHFTEPQRILYEVVLTLQKDLIAIIQKEGGDTLDTLFETMCVKLGKYLQEVGLISKDISDTTGLGQAGYKFCPHHVSHYLGMDVHDTSLIPRSLDIKPGMVFTIEPGIYIATDREDVPKEFRGIGVRIEDDVLITQNNEVEILTRFCLKEREDLKNLFQKQNINH